MHKLILSSLFVVFCSMCLLHAEEPQIGTRLEETIGSELAHSIANAQEMVATNTSTGKQFNLTQDQLKNFQEFVLSDSSYVFDFQKRCYFVPQISYEIKGSSDIKLLVSMICNQIRFDSPNQSVIIDYDLVKKEFNKLNKKIINCKHVKDEQ